MIRIFGYFVNRNSNKIAYYGTNGSDSIYFNSSLNHESESHSVSVTPYKGYSLNSQKNKGQQV